MERRLAAILAADVVGYTGLMGRDQQATLAALRGLRSDLVQDFVPQPPEIMERHIAALRKAGMPE